MDKKHRIFQRKETLPRPAVQFPLAEIGRRGSPRRRPSSPETEERDLPKQLERIILQRYRPGLRHRQGERRCRLFLRPDRPLSGTADRQPRHQCGEYGARRPPHPPAHGPAQGGELARTGGPEADLRSDQRRGKQVDLTVEPLAEFHDAESLHGRVRGRGLNAGRNTPPSGLRCRAPKKPSGIWKIELRAAQEHAQAMFEELETTNEELKSANEEFQSTNEELETSKEELQSFNEELETVNAEINRKVAELDHANSDLQNLLNSTQIATIFLDMELRIKNFTPAAGAVFRLIAGDVGRPITDLAAQFAGASLGEEVREVLRTLETRERQITAPCRAGITRCAFFLIAP